VAMDVDDFDLVIVGTGSGNSVPDEDLDDWRIAVVEPGVFGGTCLNRGCIPSKMFVYTADVARAVRGAGRYDLDATLSGSDWAAIRDRVFGRIDPIAADGHRYRAGLSNTTVFEEPARFVGPRTLRVGDRTIRGAQVVLAAGSRPTIPEVPGIHDVAHVTSDTVMRLDQRPDRLLVLGGGFIATEMGHVFDALGTDVTIVTRGDSLVTHEDDDVRHALTARYRERGIEVVTGATATSVRSDGAPVVMTADVAGEERTFRADLLLVATGRVSNHDTLDLGTAGIETTADGRPAVDAFQRTSDPAVWSLGDLSSDHQLKHVANAEARAVAHNIRHPEDPMAPVLPVVPRAVFGSPQVASVGATERELRAAGTPYLVAHRDYGSTAYGWAMEDTTSFAKVLVDPGTRHLLGAHVIGPQASLVIQPLVQAMALGSTVDEVARQVVYVHPALSEVVENVLLEVPDAAVVGG
jgi:mycothione reductase